MLDLVAVKLYMNQFYCWETNKKPTKTDRQNDSPCDPTTAGSDTGSGGLSRTDAFGTNPALEQVS